jgi:hypothetical protein
VAISLLSTGTISIFSNIGCLRTVLVSGPEGPRTRRELGEEQRHSKTMESDGKAIQRAKQRRSGRTVLATFFTTASGAVEIACCAGIATRDVAVQCYCIKEEKWFSRAFSTSNLIATALVIGKNDDFLRAASRSTLNQGRQGHTNSGIILLLCVHY